jgi:hypothetical protein
MVLREQRCCYPLPDFTRRLIEDALPVWGWGPPPEKEKRLHDLLDATTLLKHHDLCGTGVIRAYHARRVASLLACALPLYRMTPDVQLDGTMLAQGALYDSEVMQCIKEVMEESDIVFPTPGHPVMRPDMGFVDLVSPFWFSSPADPSTPLFDSES